MFSTNQKSQLFHETILYNKKILEKTKKNYYCMLFLYLTLNMRFAPLMECHLYSIVSNISYIQARRKK